MVTPFAFQRNLITYSTTGSKAIVSLTSQWESSGSYTTVSNVATKPRDKLICPIGDVINVFDNNQKVGKHSGRIREGSSVPQSVCTAVTHIVPHPVTRLQSDPSLHPSHYLSKSDIKDVLHRVGKSEQKHIDFFRKYRGQYIEEKLREVLAEQSDTLGHYSDYVDLAVVNGAGKVVCSSCKSVSSNANVSCTNCKANPNDHELDHDPYYRTSSLNRNVLPDIVIGESCMENPCSINACKGVSKHITDLAIKDDECDDDSRNWTVIVCDGVPYVYLSNVQDHTVKCETCGAIFSDSTEHSDCNGLSKPYYGDFILLPGPGHIEINMGRAALKLMWEPVLNHISSLLGFRSANAKRVFKAGIDHHRTRQTLLALSEALSKELITPYIRYCLSNDEIVSTEGYASWVEESETVGPTYMFFYHCAFSYLLAFNLYTEGTRKNNSLTMQAARVEFTPLFYAFNNPKYQLLHLRDMCQREQYPSPVSKFVTSNESFRRNLDCDSAQGADFIQEEMNRLQKSFLPPTMPTAETWCRISRNASSLQKIKENMMAPTKTRKRKKRFDHEITMMRREFRAAQLFDDATEQILSVDHVVLDWELSRIKDIAKSQYETYKDCYLRNKRFGFDIEDRQLLFITPAERDAYNDIKSKKKEVIIKEIYVLLGKLVNNETAGYIKDSLGKTPMQLTKPVLLEKYEELLQLHEIDAFVIEPTNEDLDD